MSSLSNVRLPGWIFDVAENEENLKQLVLGYVKARYPDYRVTKVKGYFAICDIGR